MLAELKAKYEGSYLLEFYKVLILPLMHSKNYGY